jgi:hypothetical protein
MTRAGFALEGNLLNDHRVRHFGVRTAGWPAIALDDRFRIPLNEILTVDLRENDWLSTSVIPTIVEQPISGKLVVNADGTVSYQPQQVGEDRFTYALDHGGIVSEAEVQLTIEPALGPTLPETIPLVRTFEDNFEARIESTWIRQGDRAQIKYPTQNVISGASHLEFNLPSNFTQTTTLRHSEPEGRNYLHMQFDFRPEGLTLGSGQTSQAVMQAFGPHGMLFSFFYRQTPTPSIYLQGLSKSGPWTGSGWKNLNMSLDSQSIEIEWWGSHPGYPGGGMRLWLEGNKVYEVNDFTFRHHLIQHIDIGWAGVTQQGTSGQFSVDNFILRRSAYVVQFHDDFEGATSAWDSWFDPNQLSGFTTIDPLNGNQSFSVDERGGNDLRAYLGNTGVNAKHMRMQARMAAREVIMDAAANHLFLMVWSPTAPLVRGFYRHHPEPGMLVHGFQTNGHWSSGGWRELPAGFLASHTLVATARWSDSPFEDNDGIRLWFDGVNAFDIKHVDHGDGLIDQYFFGITGGLDPGTDGLFLFDDFRWWIYEVRE